jgi:hypothetical protein
LQVQNEGNNWVQYKAIGTESNVSAIGTRVEILVGDRFTADEVNAGASYASQNSSRLHFGLGNNRMINQVTFRWPSGMVETYEDIPANQIYYVKEGVGIQDTEFEKVVTSFQDPLENSSFRVYPNPFTDNIHFEALLPYPGNLKIRLFDAAGRTLSIPYDGIIRSGQFELTIGTGFSNHGLLFYQLIYGNQTVTGKLLRTTDR